MTPFLKQIAYACYRGGSLEDKCFVFPNRRSSVFFTKYLKDAAADPSAMPPGGVKKPFRMPMMLTISDFFFRAHSLATEDRVSLLLELYDCYRELNPTAEPLDEFLGWGEIILADFSDVDKYMADPRIVFANVSDYKGMQDDLSYLSDAQRKAIEDFMGHFRDNSGMLPNAGSGVKAGFLKIWDLLYPLYRKFNGRLAAEGRAYDGMAYRRLTEALKEQSAPDFFAGSFPGVGTFVFVGLNALTESERFVLRKMKKAGMAEFCWDFSSPMLRNMRNRASAYMTQNLEEFGQKWELDLEGTGTPEIKVLAIPSSTGQAKQLPQILAKAGITGTPDCNDCAVVLPDEGLLVPVLNSIPQEISEINVTMGYPMRLSGVWPLLSLLPALQLHMREKDGGWLFHHRQTRAILSDGLVRRLLDEKGAEIAARILSGARYYIPQSEFAGSPLLETIFTPVVKSPDAADADQVAAFSEYLKRTVTALVGAMADDDESALETEFARRFYQCVTMLEDKRLAIKISTWQRLLSSIAAGESVPFSGEPLRGLQIMGPLETRGLDFKNIVILSCNEGIFPKKTASSSFIPPELRKGFGLPTSEFKDAVLAYVFYRMIQRAETVWLVYDSRMEKTKSGEESRYIKQLEYHFRLAPERYVARSSMSVRKDADGVPKPADIEERLNGITLSVSALKNYLNCPAMFWYANVEKLRNDTKVAEAMDGSMIGNVYHAVMQALYLGGPAMDPGFSMERQDIRAAKASGRLVPLGTVDDAYITSWMGRKEEIRAKVRALIRTQLESSEIRGRNLVYEEIILQYVLKTLERDRERIRLCGCGGFRVIGLEEETFWNFGGRRFVGFIDRIDSFSGDSVRIVDYKTGRVGKFDLDVTDGNAEELADRLFTPDSSDKPEIALQMALYDKFTEKKPWRADRRLVSIVYPVASLFTTPVADLEMTVPEKFSAAVLSRLSDTLEEMADPSKPFRRTGLRTTCSFCDFKNICGR